MTTRRMTRSVALWVKVTELTALKTLSLRLRGTAADIQALGEDADGAMETTSKLRDLLLGLTKGKVDIQIDEDTYKSTYQMMLEMSKVWQDLTDMEQAAALEAMFGKRQANIGASILTNMTDAEAALETSLNSAGSAMKENEKRLDSIEGRMAQLSATFQAFSMATFDSSFLKSLIVIFDNLLKGATAFSNAVGTLPALITAVTLALSVMGKRSGKMYARPYLEAA